MRKEHLIPPLRVPPIYARASALWIALSDRITALQTYKGGQPQYLRLFLRSWIHFEW